jgi:LCP family protein required for cell wall assembly
MTVHLRRRRPAVAAGLSFLFPGLGHAYLGRRRLAAALGLPVLVLVAVAAVTLLVLGERIGNQLLSSTFLAVVLAVDVALLAWRLFAIVHAGLAGPTGWSVARSDWLRLTAIGLFAIGAIAMHAYVGMVVVRLNAALDQVFVGEVTDPDDEAPEEIDDDAPLNVPEYRWDGTEPINFLLIGLDATGSRDEALADTILVVSVDPVAHEATMVSIPRDTGFMPLPDTTVYGDGLYPRKINALAAEATRRPEAWCPDRRDAAPADCGLRTLQRSVGLYLGIEINHYALIDLGGFIRLIDAIGGVEICLPGSLQDAGYDNPRTEERGIVMEAGCRRLDGAEALAYARIRQGEMVMPDGSVEPQDDFKRAERQQEVLLALRRELAAADLVFELPSLLDAVARTVKTDFPRARAGDLASLLPLVTGPDIERVVLGLPEFVDPPLDPQGDYLLIPRPEAVREEAERLFGPELSGWYQTSGEPPSDVR